MASMSKHGSKIAQSTAPGHVQIRRWVESYCNSWDEEGNCNGYGGGYYDYSTASATINGVADKPSGNVYVNGVPVAVQNTPTKETEVHSIHSGWEAYGQHYNGTGKIMSGNNNNVYANNISIAIVGSQVRTHAGNNTTISTGSNNVFIGG